MARKFDALEYHRMGRAGKIEVVPTRVWDNAVQKTERMRLSNGKAEYAKYIAASIRRLEKYIAAAYSRFVLRAAVPTARFHGLAVGNRQELVPYTPRGGVRPCAFPTASVVIVADTDSNERPTKLVSLIEREVAALSKLPNLQSQVAELRITGGNLELAENSED